jgi:hypothetical protein
MSCPFCGNFPGCKADTLAQDTRLGATMAKMNVDYGQTQIAAFNEAARAGAIQFDPEAVREAVRLYSQMITHLTVIRQKLDTVKDAKGFGGFPSGLELRDGFVKKAAEGVDVIDQLIEGAKQLQEAYMRADKAISEVDKANADRTALLGNLLGKYSGAK